MMSKGFWLAIAAIVFGVAGFWGLGSLYQPTVAANTESTAIEVKPTIHNDASMALAFANERLSGLKQDYAANVALYENKDSEGLLGMRSELIEAMNDNQYDNTSELRYYHGCDQAHQALVFLNAYYANESDLEDGHDLQKIAGQEAEYNKGLALCEEQVQSGADTI